MAHTLKTSKGTSFIHNSFDMKGLVTIVPSNKNQESTVIPYKDLLEFIVEGYKANMINKIESMDAEEVMKNLSFHF